MNILLTLFYVFTLLSLRVNGVEEREWKLSKEDFDEMEKQIQLRSNHTVKTIQTRHGDIYDCMNFYKQPAFDHHLLKNHNITLQKKPTLSHEKARNKVFATMTSKLGLGNGGCPDGTIPIQRVSKEDLIRAKLAQVNDDEIGFARCSTQERTGYTGVSASVAVYNPEIRWDNQCSAAVIKLHFGPESIEAGWRVDPQLFGDKKTRLYIRTNARNAQCFNTQCPGFVLTNKHIPLGVVFEKVSTPGGEGWEFDLSITQDGTGSWILRLEGDNEIGQWPIALFEHPGAANYVEWGGEVSAPPRHYKPEMGSGRTVNEDTAYDAFYSNMKVKNGPTTGGPSLDPVDLICKASTALYKAKDEGNVGDGLEYLIFYGGPSEF